MPKNTIEVVFSAPAGATSIFVPIKERCKLVGMRVASNTNRGTAKAIGAYKGATKLAEVAAMDTTPGVVDDATLETAANSTIFEMGDPIKITIDSGTAALVAVTLVVDPFCITQFQT